MAVISDWINIIPESTDDGSGTGGVPGDPNGGEDPFANPPTGGGPGGGGPYDGADPDAIADASILADVISVSDYYPFGLHMNGRTFSADTYRSALTARKKTTTESGGRHITTMASGSITRA